MAQGQKKVKVRVISKNGNKTSLALKIGGKDEVVLPNEKIDVPEKELDTLNSLSKAWKFEKIEEDK